MCTGSGELPRQSVNYVWELQFNAFLKAEAVVLEWGAAARRKGVGPSWKL